MKKIMIPFVASLYLIDIFLLMGIYGGENFMWANHCILPLCLISFFLAIFNLMVALKSEKEDSLIIFKQTMIFKIILIPFHLFSFVFCILLLVGSIACIFTLFWLATLPLIGICFLIWIYCYLMMVSSGIHSIVRLLREKKEYGIVFIVIYCILHFFYFTDLISSICLYYSVKKKNREINSSCL